MERTEECGLVTCGEAVRAELLALAAVAEATAEELEGVHLDAESAQVASELVAVAREVLDRAVDELGRECGE
jgi:hypothetical protein